VVSARSRVVRSSFAAVALASSASLQPSTAAVPQRDQAEPPPCDRIGDLAAQARESSGCATTAITRNNQ
jgi:hypothetical protein